MYFVSFEFLIILVFIDEPLNVIAIMHFLRCFSRPLGDLVVKLPLTNSSFFSNNNYIGTSNLYILIFYFLQCKINLLFASSRKPVLTSFLEFQWSLLIFSFNS